MPGDTSTYPPVVAVFKGTAAHFDETVDHVEERIDALDDERATPQVGLDDEEFQEQVDEVQGQLDELDTTDAQPNVTLDDAEAEGALDELSVQLAALDAEAVAPTVFIDTAPAEADLADLDSQMAANITEAQALRATLAAELAQALAQIEAESAGAATRGDLLAASLDRQTGSAAGATVANQGLAESLSEVQAAYDAGTISAEEYAAATALSDDEAEALEARFNGMLSGSTHLLKQIGITDVIARLTAAGLVARSVGNDFADLDGNLITAGQVLSQYGIVLTTSTVSIGGMEQALHNFAAEGIEPVSFALSDLDPSLQAFADDIAEAGPSTIAIADAMALAAPAIRAAASATAAFNAGMQAADIGYDEMEAGLAALGAEAEESSGFLAAFAAEWDTIRASTEAATLSAFGTSLPFGLGAVASGLTSAVRGVGDFAGALANAMPEESGFGDGLSAISEGFESISESSAAMAGIVIPVLASLIPVLAVAGGAVLGLAGGLIEGVVELGVFAVAAYGAGVSLTTLEDTAKTAFHEFAGAYRSTIQGVVNEIGPLLTGTLDDMDPVLRGAITGFHDMFALIDQDVHSSAFRTFFKWVGSEAQAGAVTFTDAFQGFAGGLSKMAENAGPFIHMLESGLISLGKDLTHLGTSSEFKSFIDYLVREAPKADQFVKGLWGAFEQLAIVGAEVGEVGLPLVTDALDVLVPTMAGAYEVVKFFAGQLERIKDEFESLPGVSQVGGFFGTIDHYINDITGKVPGLDPLIHVLTGITVGGSKAAKATTAVAKSTTRLTQSIADAVSVSEHLGDATTSDTQALSLLDIQAGVTGTKLKKALATAASTATSAFTTAQNAVSNLQTIISAKETFATETIGQITAQFQKLGSAAAGASGTLHTFYATQISEMSNFAADIRAMEKEGYGASIIHSVLSTATAGPAAAAAYAAGGSALAAYVNGATGQLGLLDTLAGKINADTSAALLKTSPRFGAAAGAAVQILTIEMQDGGKASMAALAAGVSGGLPEVERVLDTFSTLLPADIVKALTTTGTVMVGSALQGMTKQAALRAIDQSHATLTALGKIIATTAAQGVTDTVHKVSLATVHAIQEAIKAGKGVDAKPVGHHMMTDIHDAIVTYGPEISEALTTVVTQAIRAAAGLSGSLVGSEIDSSIAAAIMAGEGHIGAATKSVAQSAENAVGTVHAPAPVASGGTAVVIHNHFTVDSKDIATAIAPQIRSANAVKARGTRNVFGNWGGTSR